MAARAAVAAEEEVVVAAVDPRRALVPLPLNRPRSRLPLKL